MLLGFGPFTVDCVRRTVKKNGLPLHLTMRCTELLIALVRNAGKPMSKQQLLDAAWPDPEASDATLAQHMFLLRRALRDERREWIETMPNFGYRFTGAIREIGAVDDERTRAIGMYLKGAREFRALGTGRALHSAIDLCTQALLLDDTSADAYALRASCRRALAESMVCEALPCLSAAKTDAEAGVMREAAHVEARVEAALSGALLDRDTAAARRHLDIAAARAPEDAGVLRARVLIALMDARTDEALRIARTAGHGLYGTALYMSGEFAQARAVFEGCPADDPGVHLMRGACRMLEGDFSGALADFRSAAEAPAVRQYAMALSIYALAKNASMNSARLYAKRLEQVAQRRYVSSMTRALAHFAFGDRERGMTFVNAAIAARDPWSAYANVDPLFAQAAAMAA